MKKRRYRRYGAYKRRRRYRARSRSMTKRPSCKAEVKFFNISATRQSVKMTIPNGSWTGSPSNSSSAFSFQLNNILQNIAEGTDVFERVGRKIFLKSIKVHHIVELCSSDNTYAINSGLLRITWTNNIGTPQSTLFNNWYKRPIMDRILGAFNNEFYHLHYNKVYNLTSGLPNLNSGTSKTQGLIKHIKYTIPVNRAVTFDYSGAIKSEKDYFSLFMQGAVPGGTDNMQCFCVNTSATAYYTDC